jgi:hypothetical protein
MRCGRRFTTLVVTILASSGCTMGGRGGSAAESTASPGPVSPSGSAAAPTWRLAEVPQLRTGSALRGVVAVDPTHAWAVGFEEYSPDRPDTSSVPVIVRWDGAVWSRDALPPISWHGALRLVAADSPANVWAVGGSTGPTPQDTITHVFRYDGSGWREVPFPPGNSPSIMQITGLTAVAGRAWLVGNKLSEVVIQEWDGQTWRSHQPPTECVQPGTSFGGMPTFCTFTGITAFAPNDIWVAGNAAWPGFQGPLLFHWNGEAWRPIQVGINQQMSALTAVGGRTSTNRWAAGNVFNSPEPVVVHGDNSTWTVVEGVPQGMLAGLTVDAAGRPWLLRNTNAPGAYLSTHSGTGSWSDTPAPRPPGTVGSTLSAITAVPGSSMMFAVGNADLPTDARTITAVIVQYSTGGAA